MFKEILPLYLLFIRLFHSSQITTQDNAWYKGFIFTFTRCLYYSWNTKCKLTPYVRPAPKEKYSNTLSTYSLFRRRYCSTVGRLIHQDLEGIVYPRLVRMSSNERKHHKEDILIHNHNTIDTSLWHFWSVLITTSQYTILGLRQH